MSRTLLDSPAEHCVHAVRALGPAGPIAGTVMLFNSTLIGVRAERSGVRITLTYIWVSPSMRDAGDGTRALRELLALADRYNLEVALRPASFDRRHGGRVTGPSTLSLQKWYAAHGFVKFPHFPTRMVRPRKSPKP